LPCSSTPQGSTAIRFWKSQWHTCDHFCVLSWCTERDVSWSLQHVCK
jgi:hypothetical protein